MIPSQCGISHTADSTHVVFITVGDTLLVLQYHILECLVFRSSSSGLHLYYILLDEIKNHSSSAYIMFIPGPRVLLHRYISFTESISREKCPEVSLETVLDSNYCALTNILLIYCCYDLYHIIINIIRNTNFTFVLPGCVEYI